MGLSEAHGSGESPPPLMPQPLLLASWPPPGHWDSLHTALCLQLSLLGPGPQDALVSGAEVGPSVSLHPSTGPCEESRPPTEQVSLSPPWACQEPRASLDTSRGSWACGARPVKRLYKPLQGTRGDVPTAAAGRLQFCTSFVP